MSDDFMGGGGARAFPFTQPGAKVTGLITQLPEKRQQTDLNTGQPKFFRDSGDPMWVYVVQIKTDLRDPEDQFDDGIRSLWLKGGPWDPNRRVGASLRAVQEAIKAAGAKLPEIGAELTLAYVCDGPAGRGQQAPKFYGALYVPPTAGSFMAAETQQAQPQQLNNPQNQIYRNGQQGSQNYAQPSHASQSVPQGQGVMAQLRAQQDEAVNRLQQGPVPF